MRGEKKGSVYILVKKTDALNRNFIISIVRHTNIDYNKYLILYSWHDSRRFSGQHLQ